LVSSKSCLFYFIFSILFYQNWIISAYLFSILIWVTHIIQCHNNALHYYMYLKKISHHRFSSFIYMLIKGSWYITLLPPSIQETVIGMHVHYQDTNLSRVNGDYMMILIHTRNFISALLYLNGTIRVMMWTFKL
jgi:hypothetical protein